MRLDSFLCFGKCEQGPNVRIDETLHLAVGPEKLDVLLAKLLAP